ncbi:MAG: long-chain fatty acid--CoA ligase [Gammaproteobacteria bacterium]|nr:long-chain fatty acid--CoA ligase [Gammaproteobacteria bacterium]
MGSDVTPKSEATVYPEDAIAAHGGLDVIEVAQAGNLPGLFRERARRTPQALAFREYDDATKSWCDYTWAAIAAEVSRWQAALSAEPLQPGDRVALRMRNRRHWVIFEQAALACGLVVVPLYVADRADNVAYSINDSGACLLLLESAAQWAELADVESELDILQRIVILEGIDDVTDPRVTAAIDWLPSGDSGELENRGGGLDELATIVYTSGTTGAPKGVMLSHRNILSNAYMGLQSVAVTTDDLFLSFLPLSHTLERTAGYYIPMMAGAAIAYARSIPDMPEDLLQIRPTALISVPRIFERVYKAIQTQLEQASSLKRGLFNLTLRVGWERHLHRQNEGPWRASFLLWPLLDRLVAAKVRAKLGGRLSVVVSGGAPLPPVVGRAFIGLGVNILQGYGLTETSPSLSINTLNRNRPSSIGLPLNGVALRIGDDDELLAKSPSVMMGYWGKEQATADAIDTDGWFHTGDCARIEDGFVYITGRIKDILVLSNGEKVPPADMESAIADDALFDQSMIIGEGRSYLSVIVVLNPDLWSPMAAQLGVDPNDRDALQQDDVKKILLERVATCIEAFPGYARIYQITAVLDPWDVENGLLTPTLKVKRAKITERYRDAIEQMYAGH